MRPLLICVLFLVSCGFAAAGVVNLTGRKANWRGPLFIVVAVVAFFPLMSQMDTLKRERVEACEDRGGTPDAYGKLGLNIECRGVNDE